MVLVKRFTLILTYVLLLPLSIAAQDLESISKLEDQIRQLETLAQNVGSTEEVRSLNANFLTTRRAQLHALLETRIRVLREYQRATDAILTVAEKESLNNEIKHLNEKLDAVKTNQSRGNTGSEAVATPNTPLIAGTTFGAPVGPRFLLSHPASGRTDLPTEDFKLSWTKPTWATSYTVEIREDQAFGTAGEVHRQTVTRPNFTVPKDILKPGKEYYWQVTADCNPANATCAGATTVLAANGPYSFSTVRQLGFFNYLSNKGFSLQRVVAGDDESEGATFSFLRTVGKKTVYATDFAFIWDSMEAGQGNTRYTLQSSVEGHLTSDDSEAEDALRFGTGANILTRFGSTGLTGLHSMLSAKLEADQRFTTKKFFFEAQETLTKINYFMGRYSGRVSDPVQFRWRPFLAFQMGHTFKQGEGRLPEKTVLRLIPRARLELKLNFISRALKIPRTLLFADETFYYLPIEAKMRSTNFLASGLEFDFTPNLGLSFNYKNGKAAPKFQHVHTFGGAFTVRFGKNEQ